MQSSAHRNFETAYRRRRPKRVAVPGTRCDGAVWNAVTVIRLAMRCVEVAVVDAGFCAD